MNTPVVGALHRNTVEETRSLAGSSTAVRRTDSLPGAAGIAALEAVLDSLDGLGETDSSPGVAGIEEAAATVPPTIAPGVTA